MPAKVFCCVIALAKARPGGSLMFRKMKSLILVSKYQDYVGLSGYLSYISSNTSLAIIPLCVGTDLVFFVTIAFLFKTSPGPD